MGRVRVLRKLRTSAPVETSNAKEMPICSQTAVRRPMELRAVTREA